MTAATAIALPYGGSEIVAQRSAGNRPADMVIVSLIGPLREENPVVVAKPGRAYDWRFLADLDVMIVAGALTDPGAVRAVVEPIRAVAGNVSLWISDRQDGAWIGSSGAHPLTVADRIAYAGLGFTSTRDDAMDLIAQTVKARAVANSGRFDEGVASLATSGLRAMLGKAWSAA